MSELCRITIAMPESLEDEVVEALLQLHPAVSGFTTFDAEGHGQSFDKARTRERVRGRVGRKLLWAILPRTQVDRVIDHLKARISNAEAAWWIEPVERFGRLQ
jgi:hypothetical protein